MARSWPSACCKRPGSSRGKKSLSTAPPAASARWPSSLLNITTGQNVTGVCGTPRLDYVKALGADKVIDYTQQDFTQNGETYDVIFDILGRSSFVHCKNSLKPNGIYLLFASFKGRASRICSGPPIASRQKVICAMAEEKTASLLLVKDLAEAGKIKALVDKRFPLEQTAEAHRYIESGGRQGNVVLTVAQA
jgi:NADPH:quinone reductase-like Zn-dependent oxidoreductase